MTRCMPTRDHVKSTQQTPETTLACLAKPFCMLSADVPVTAHDTGQTISKCPKPVPAAAHELQPV
eukprot:6201439-Pleurochrysis_carterae.AAC.3